MASAFRGLSEGIDTLIGLRKYELDQQRLDADRAAQKEERDLRNQQIRLQTAGLQRQEDKAKTYDANQQSYQGLRQGMALAGYDDTLKNKVLENQANIMGDAESADKFSAARALFQKEGVIDTLRLIKAGKYDEAAQRYNSVGDDKVDKFAPDPKDPDMLMFTAPGGKAGSLKISQIEAMISDPMEARKAEKTRNEKLEDVATEQRNALERIRAQGEETRRTDKAKPDPDGTFKNAGKVISAEGYPTTEDNIRQEYIAEYGKKDPLTGMFTIDPEKSPPPFGQFFNSRVAPRYRRTATPQPMRDTAPTAQELENAAAMLNVEQGRGNDWIPFNEFTSKDDVVRVRAMENRGLHKGLSPAPSQNKAAGLQQPQAVQGKPQTAQPPVPVRPSVSPSTLGLKTREQIAAEKAANTPQARQSLINQQIATSQAGRVAEQKAMQDKFSITGKDPGAAYAAIATGSTRANNDIKAGIIPDLKDLAAAYKLAEIQGDTAAMQRYEQVVQENRKYYDK